MAGKSASVLPLLTTSSFMSIVGVEQTVGRGVGSRACVVCIAAEKSTKERTRTAVEIIQKRDSCFITTPALIQKSGLDFKPKARQVVRLRPSRPAQRRRMLSGRVESYTQNLAGQITARLANNKAARNPVIVPIGSTKKPASKGLVDQISPLDYDNGLRH